MTKQRILKTAPNSYGWYLRVQYRKSMSDLVIRIMNVDGTKFTRECYINKDDLPAFVEFVKNEC